MSKSSDKTGTKTYASKHMWTVMDKVLHISGWVLAFIQLAATGVFALFIQYIGMIPFAYKLLIAILLVMLSMLTLVTQHWKIPGIITKIISLIISTVLIVGCVYINTTRKAIDNISGSSTHKSEIGVYVLQENEAQTMDELIDKSFGINGITDRDNTDKVIEEINSGYECQITTAEYQDSVALAEGLYSGEVNAIILNTAYVDMIEENEDYRDFQERTRLITTMTYENEVVKDNNDDYLSGDGIFTMYISGIDTNGEPTVNRNSDVNILMTVNTNTHQILMINTPRDFYVPTTVSGGMPDKLTHAGCYGIDCSVGTLEMLYGINIDYYMKVNFTGFVDIINLLGGVEVYSETEFTAWNGGYHIVEGNNYLNGEQALGFARERYAFGSGDRQRGKNQMKVIKAVINKMLSTDMLMNYSKILDAVSASMITSMSYDEISELVQMQLNGMPSWDIQTYSVDGTGDTLSSYSLSTPNYVMIPNEDTVSQAKAYLAAIYDNQIIDTATQQQ